MFARLFIIALLPVMLRRTRERPAVSHRMESCAAEQTILRGGLQTDQLAAMRFSLWRFVQIASANLRRVLRLIADSLASLRLTTRRPAFTLLELAVVLLIIGLVLAVAMPHFGAFQGAELRSEARRLAARSHYLYEEAGAEKVLLSLNLDLDHSTYFVTRLDPFAAEPSFRPETGPAGGVATMPADVRLRDVWVEGGGLSRGGIVKCQFYPGGIADATVIHLFDRNGDVLTIGIDPFNGAVSIISGDLSPAAMQREARR
jgi:prepilin-type N-terminal cleavage/methylation domain-containing protein